MTIKILLAGALCTFAFADPLVWPSANATVSGGATSGFPSSALSGEIQIVYDPGQTSTGPINITGFSFRAAPGTGPFSMTISGGVYLSTSPNYPNSTGHPLLSTTFANNVGPDNTLVFSGTASMSGAACAAPGPCPFGNGIVFRTPFLYNPANGPLLVDMKLAGISGIGQTDSIQCSAPGCSVAGTTTSPYPGSPTGVGVQYGGTIVEITTTTGPSSYYFSDVAFGGGFQTTLTYVNYSPQTVTCSTTFYSNSGGALPVPFSQETLSSRTDILQPGQSIHDPSVASLTDPVSEGWAQASCTGPVQASLLYRLYRSGVPAGEASVSAETAPTTQFVTFAQTATGVAYANPSTAQSATITFTVYSATGTRLGSLVITLGPLAHGSATMGSLLGLQSFTGLVKITSTIPIISLSLNFEAFPVFSSLPPGDLPSSTVLVP